MILRMKNSCQLNNMMHHIRYLLHVINHFRKEEGELNLIDIILILKLAHVINLFTLEKEEIRFSII